MYYVGATEEQARLVGTLTGEVLVQAGRMVGPGWAGVRTGLEWAGSRSGSGHGDCNAAQHHLVNTVVVLLVPAVRPCAVTLTEGKQQNRDKEKRGPGLHTGLCYACTVGACGWTTDYPILLEVQADD